jgi:hypothetical protein
MFRLDLTAHELEEAVRRLHVQLDPSQPGGRLVALDTALAHELYRKLFPMGPALL